MSKEAPQIAFKQLRLIHPEKGLVDAPMFISPMLDRKTHCDTCQVAYSPLPYQAQQEVRSQHFHEGKGGGIYYYMGGGDEAVEQIVRISHGWLAFVEPRGREVVISPGTASITSAKAEGVMVQGIYAFVEQEGKIKPLSEGVIFAIPGNTFLVPRPYGARPEAKQRELEDKFHFQVQDGVVYFSLPRPYFHRQ